MITKNLSESEVKDALYSQLKKIDSSTPAAFGDFIAQSAAAYENKWHRRLPESSKAILAQSMNKMTDLLQTRDRMSKEQIMSAVSDVSKVDNPITLAYNLLSILIPNFAYTEVMGLQPIPTKESPIFYPQITANESRNNVAKGSVLLGSTNWNESNTFTTNKVSGSFTLAASVNQTFTAPEGNIIPGSLSLSVVIGSAQAYVMDDGKGGLVSGLESGGSPLIASPAGTVNYATGAIALKLTIADPTAVSGASITASYRYDLDTAVDAQGNPLKPAQAVLEWVTKMIRAEPYRVRTTYSLDNFFQVKQVLNGYNIDQVLSSSVAGYINKEISGNVFDDLLTKVDATYTWDSTNPTGVAWALHRLSLVQSFVQAGNGIRKNIARAGGNIVVAGTDWMNFIETLGDDLWKPVTYSEEPIGPYVAGTLAGKFKVLKNQEYPDSKAVMVYKRDDLDASVMGGVFIGLYTTNPIAMDDLHTIQGMGTQFGWTKAFDNSIVELVLQ
jgi:hypothetical protein